MLGLQLINISKRGTTTTRKSRIMHMSIVISDVEHYGTKVIARILDPKIH